MNLRRMNKVLKNLIVLEPEKLDMRVCVRQHDGNGCGTVCCVIGWFPKWFPKYWKWNQYGHARLTPELRENIGGIVFESAAKFLAIPYDDVNYLFNSNVAGKKDAVKRLSHYIKTGGLYIPERT